MKSKKDFIHDPEQFNFRTAKAIWLNSSIKKFFHRAMLIDNTFRNKVKHLKSHGVDYYVLGGKVIICFKKMDYKSRVSGFYSKRFKNLMEGNAIHYSKIMLENLAEMGIQKALPIYFVGHVVDVFNGLVDVRLVHYNESKIAYQLSLTGLNKPSLFSSNNTNKEFVTPKGRKVRKSS